MKTLMRNGRDRRSENPSLGHAKKERVSLFGTDQRITSGPVARRPHSKAEYMTAPERFADSQIALAPRAPSIHDRFWSPLMAFANGDSVALTRFAAEASDDGAAEARAGAAFLRVSARRGDTRRSPCARDRRRARSDLGAC